MEAKQTPLKTRDGLSHNVCAYCRVSTDDEDQKNSLASQQAFFDTFFHRHPNWTNVGIFADEGISGTSLEKRDQFNEMLSLARYGGVEIILTKEVSRFSRNVQHLLNIVEELRGLGVYIWFLSDDINTESNDYRERLTQVATNAEQESLRTSRRVRWGQQQRMEQGAVFGRKEMFGYNIERDQFGIHRFVIIPEEAEIVRQVFQWFASGDGTYTIAKRLQQMGVKTKRYKNGWSNTVILRLLRNEKYVGDLAQGKTYTPDPLTHKKKYNRGESVRYYITDHHPESAIIDRELWNKVQALLKEREPSDDVKAMHSNRYWTSGKIFCGCCGGKYVSMRKKQKNIPYKAWVCYNNNQRGLPHEITNDKGETISVGCVGKRVNERVLRTALYDILTQIIIPRKDEICNALNAEFEALSRPKDNTAEIAATERKLAKLNDAIVSLTDKFVRGLIPEVAYTATAKSYDEEIKTLQTTLAQLKSQGNTTAQQRAIYQQYIAEIEEIVAMDEDSINEGLFARITKRIVVHPEQVLEIHLSFYPRPIFLQYRTKGRGEDYTAEFDILTAYNPTERPRTATNLDTHTDTPTTD